MLRLRHVLHSTFVLSLYLDAAAQSMREDMLAEARKRIGVWHRDPALIEPPLVKKGIALTMLKQDLKCGGGNVPVGFAEFVVPGVRPVDVFNTVMDVAGQPKWNKKCAPHSMKFVGDWRQEGARGWDNVFNLIFDKKLEFLVWQVAHTDFENEQFWMVTSTQNNSALRNKSPRQDNWIESHNCLGAYHISKVADGARVVVTQHVSTPFSLWFPLHQILKVFPIAWQGMVAFIQALSRQAERQRLLAWSNTTTKQPAWLLEGPAGTNAADWKVKMRLNASAVMSFSEEISQTTSQRQWLRIGAIVAIVVVMMCCCGCFYCLHHLFGQRRSLSRQNSECGSTVCSGRSVADLSEFDYESQFDEDEDEDLQE